MQLTKAIESVVKDTREQTDPDMTIIECIAMCREYSGAEFDAWLDEGIVDKSLHTAYCSVADATEAEIERAAGIVIASL